jgi:hypothetical protein
MFLTSWKNLTIYNIKNPTSPQLVGYEPLGFQFENEQVSTNGKIMLFSESLPGDTLHVWDVEDKSNPVEIAQLDNAGDHTQSCILNCKWSYGSDGTIVDLRNPAKPKLVAARGSKLDWHKQTKLQGGGHDVYEYKPGFLITSPISHPGQILDVRNPKNPKVLALAKNPNPGGFLFHSAHWPRKGKDRFALFQGEKNFNARCNDNNGPFMTFDTRGWKRTKQFKLKDTFRVKNGTYIDGSPAVNALGCSAHWFEHHPTFKNGGLVAMGYYEHGTRFFDVKKSGKIKQVGWFLPAAGSTSGAWWAPTDKKKRIVYAVDYTRGIDILRYKGKF